MTATALTPVRSPSGPASWQHCHDVAREHGLAPALTALHALVGPGTPVLGGGGVAVVADDDVAALGIEPSAVLRRAGLPGGTVAVVRTGQGPAVADPTLVTGALWVRLGISARLLEDCVAHLGGRVSGDHGLLARQLVQGAVAEAAIGRVEVRARLVASGATPLSGVVAGHLHRTLTDVDRTVLRLFGATGFLAGGPGETADVAELLGGVHRPGEDL